MSKQVSKPSACLPPTCCKSDPCRKDLVSPMPEDGLKALVDYYWAKHKNDYKCEDRWWTAPKTWEKVCERAWKSIMYNGKLHGHQRRIATHLAKGLAIALAENKSPGNFADFDSLHLSTGQKS